MYPAVYIIIWSNEMAVTIIFHKTIFGLFLVAVTITAGKTYVMLHCTMKI